MNMIKFFAGLLIVVSFNVLAINVGAITETIHSDKYFIAKEVSNTVDSARLVSLSVERVTSPLSGGKALPMSGKNEVMVTPANLLLPGNSKEVFRIVYGGPKDDEERYYRLLWRDEPVVEGGNSKSQKTAIATTSASISTILVVSPRQEKFKYNFDQRQGIVWNTGNTTFRVVASGPCLPAQKKNNTESCRERYYVMPGLGVHLQHVDFNQRKSSVGIWHAREFITLK